MKNISIMQGRLLPRYNNRYQAFPMGYWEAEFFIAKQLGFAGIEMILDYNDHGKNPLMTAAGLKKIKAVCAQSGTSVFSVCADYFMEAPFHSKHLKKSESVLEKLMHNCAELNIKDVVIPCVDNSSLKNDEQAEIFVRSISKFIPLAEEASININFETDLPPDKFISLLKKFDSKRIKVNYDIGNSASLGFDTLEEFAKYGKYISDLHIKDRVLGGGSVKLGTGNADFDKVFKQLASCRFAGNIVMQSARALNYIEDLQLVKEQLNFVTGYINKYLK